MGGGSMIGRSQTLFHYCALLLAGHMSATVIGRSAMDVSDMDTSVRHKSMPLQCGGNRKTIKGNLRQVSFGLFSSFSP